MLGSLSQLALALYDACMKMDIEKARPLQHKMMQMLGLLMQNYPASIKYAMELMGRPVGETRKPILPLTAEAKAHVRRPWSLSRFLRMSRTAGKPRNGLGKKRSLPTRKRSIAPPSKVAHRNPGAVFDRTHFIPGFKLIAKKRGPSPPPA